MTNEQTPISPDNLIPPDGELAQMLMQWSEDTDSRTWKIANVTNELIEELEGGIVTKKDVYRAVAARCKGRKVNTIRRWAEVAADFSPELQEQYAELLSFEHFKASRRLFNEGLTPSIDYGLQWCVEGNDDKITAGKFKTVGQLYIEFMPEFRTTTLWDRVKDGVLAEFEKVEDPIARYHLVTSWGFINETLDSLKEV